MAIRDGDAPGWHLSQLGSALHALGGRAGIIDSGRIPSKSSRLTPDDDAGEFIDWQAKALGCETARVETFYRDLESDLETAFPALLRLSPEIFLAVLRVSRRILYVLSPSGRVEKVALASVCTELREAIGHEKTQDYVRLLREAEIPERKQARAVSILVDEHFGTSRFNDAWILRPPAGSSLATFFKGANLFANGSVLVVAHTCQYLLWLVSWSILGRLSLQGRMDRGWLLAWALLLLTLVPLRVLITWLQGLVAVGLGAMLKRRLLVGALRTEAEEVRHLGVGSYLGQVFEAEAVESLALTGGVTGLLATVELIASAFVLGKLSILLGVWCAVVALVGWRFLRHYQRWTGTRMKITRGLVESMVGHRTRRAQQKPQDWHESEDQALSGYLDRSREIDWGGAWLVSALPRGWLIAGLVCLAPAAISGLSTTSDIAVTLGGILLAFNAFKKLMASSADIAVAVVAGTRVLPLFRSAARTEVTSQTPPQSSSSENGRVLEADKVSFRYRAQGRPALYPSSLAIRAGDRILLEGPSGGGKTTFASLLSGMRRPESGLVLVKGLDRETVGSERLRRQVASAPHFHDNHILTETLAFNLLMSSRWPPTQEDLQEAEEVCTELGLGDLLKRMPGGIMQMVGEGGWQLSHGERSRVYIARALLQGADLVILDESFGALDPENLRTAVQCTLNRAKTLLVIAHP